MTIVEAKKWGNSLGIIIPKEIVRELKITEKEELDVQFNKRCKGVLRELWEFGKKHGKISKNILKDIRKNESRFIK